MMINMNLGIFEMIITGALIIIAVVMVRFVAMYRLPKKTFLALWMLVLLRLLVPLSIQSQLSVFNALPEIGSSRAAEERMAGTPVFRTQVIDSPIVAPGYGNVAGMTDTSQAYVSQAFGNSNFIVRPLTIVYILGLILSASYFIATYIKHHRRFDSKPVHCEQIKLWLKYHQLKRRVQVRVSSKIKTPLTYGIFRPVILLPDNSVVDNEAELSFILAHEFVHIKRFDALLKILAAAALCLHWFNPFVWVMYVLFNRDMEISCDEAVVEMLGKSKKRGYALALVGMAERRSYGLALYSSFSKYAIEERINAIMKIKRKTAVGTIAALMIVGVTAVALATSSVNADGGVPEYIGQYPSYENGVADIDSDIPDFFINLDAPPDDSIAEFNPGRPHDFLERYVLPGTYANDYEEAQEDNVINLSIIKDEQYFVEQDIRFIVTPYANRISMEDAAIIGATALNKSFGVEFDDVNIFMRYGRNLSWSAQSTDAFMDMFDEGGPGLRVWTGLVIPVGSIDVSRAHTRYFFEVFACTGELSVISLNPDFDEAFLDMTADEIFEQWSTRRNISLRYGYYEYAQLELNETTNVQYARHAMEVAGGLNIFDSEPVRARLTSEWEWVDWVSINVQFADDQEVIMVFQVCPEGDMNLTTIHYDVLKLVLKPILNPDNTQGWIRTDDIFEWVYQ